MPRFVNMHFIMSLFSILVVTFALPQPRTSQQYAMNIDILSDGLVHSSALDDDPPHGAANTQHLEKELHPKTFRFQPNSRAQSVLHTYSPPITQECNILVKSSNTTYGYIAPRFNDFGEYGPLQRTQDGALLVSFSYSTDSPGRVDLAVTNGPTGTYPFMGGVIGYMSKSDDLSLGSFNYAYITGVKRPIGSPVPGDNSLSAASSISSRYESAIWMYNPTTKSITAQWINEDNSAPETKILYANDNSAHALLITGDSNAFRSTFGSSYAEVFAFLP